MFLMLGFEQKLMSMLAMDLNQVLTQLTQL